MLHNYTMIVNVVKLIQFYLNSKIQIYSFYRKLVKIKKSIQSNHPLRKII